MVRWRCCSGIVFFLAAAITAYGQDPTPRGYRFQAPVGMASAVDPQLTEAPILTRNAAGATAFVWQANDHAAMDEELPETAAAEKKAAEAKAGAKETQGKDAQAGDKSADAKDKSNKDTKAPKKSSGNKKSSSGNNDQQIAAGRAAFDRACTDCHDAERSTSKRKSRTAWLATIRRMAKMDGAEINSSDFGPIATYLASLNGGSAGNRAGAGSSKASDDASGANDEEGGDADEGSDDQASDEGSGDEMAAEDAGELSSGISLGGTVSTLWRGGNDNLETPNFFPDIWLSGDWQPSGPLSGRVTTCTSCHSDRTGGTGFTFEIVEASAKLDLLYKIKQCRKKAGCKEDCGWQADIKAGRLNVPFGAFAAMSHPGIYRTITNPLMFNMGRQVNPNGSRPPVLPMPYSDEGVDFSARIPLYDEINATIDLYAVNGLQGFGNGVQFSPSRSYTDNNRLPAIGGRGTVGTDKLRIGGSVMTGRMEDQGATPLGYKLTGADATWRYEKLLRTYFEYAIRANDNDNDVDIQQVSYGIVGETEVLLLEEPNISLLLRYDTLEHRDPDGEESIARFTWGLNTVLPGGSLLIINHEHWLFDEPLTDTDVVGFRWVATF